MAAKTRRKRKEESEPFTIGGANAAKAATETPWARPRMNTDEHEWDRAVM
jgi:hypothetical protein